MPTQTGEMPPAKTKAKAFRRDPRDFRPNNFSDYIDLKILDRVLPVWSASARSDQLLRSRATNYVFMVIVIELVSLSALILAIGTSKITIDAHIVEITVPCVIASIFGLARIVFKYLFDNGSKKRLDERMLERLTFRQHDKDDISATGLATDSEAAEMKASSPVEHK